MMKVHFIQRSGVLQPAGAHVYFEGYGGWGMWGRCLGVGNGVT